MPKNRPKKILKGSVLLLMGLTGIIIAKYFFSSIRLAPVCSDCNVILIVVGSINAAHVSANGYTVPTTPTIDAIMKQGISYSRAYSPSSWSTPSVMSVFTGLYPTEHRLTNTFIISDDTDCITANISRLSPHVQTIAEVMKGSGYTTAGFSEDDDTGSQYGFNLGFDTYQDHAHINSEDSASDLALSWLEKNGNQKFFLFLHLDGTNVDLNPTDGYQPTTNDSAKVFSVTKEKQKELQQLSLTEEILSVDTDEEELWKQWYDASVKDTDAQLSYFWDKFSQSELRDHTIVYLVSDHGMEIMEHHKFGSGHSLYDELLHTIHTIVLPPALTSSPGSVNTTPVTLLDVAPTILDLIGKQPDTGFAAQLRGRTLVPTLKGHQISPVDIYIETDYRDFSHQRGVITKEGWKYIITLESSLRELYYLPDDPKEESNGIFENLDRIYALDRQLKQHIRTMGDDPEKEWKTGRVPIRGSENCTF